MTGLKNFFKQLITLVPIFIAFVFLVVFFIVEVFQKGFINNHLVLFGLSVGVPMFIGIILFMGTRKNIQKDQEVRLETNIIEYCAVKGGSFTVPDVAIKFGLTLDDSSQRLVDLQAKGYFEMKVSDKGAVIYKLNNYTDPLDKESASSVL